MTAKQYELDSEWELGCVFFLPSAVVQPKNFSVTSARVKNELSYAYAHTRFTPFFRASSCRIFKRADCISSSVFRLIHGFVSISH